jgi:hypothetical protein
MMRVVARLGAVDRICSADWLMSNRYSAGSRICGRPRIACSPLDVKAKVSAGLRLERWRLRG